MKKKKHIRLLACILCVTALFCLVACQKRQGEYIPEGMLNATCAGADYRLYVPSSWTPNTAYGVSGAYYSLSNQSTVSVNRYPVTEELEAELTAALTGEGKDATESANRLEWYFRTFCLTEIGRKAINGIVVLKEEECVATSLGEVNAREFRYSARYDMPRENKPENPVDLEFLQVIAERNDAFYVFSYIAREDLYETLIGNVRSMLSEFVFDKEYFPDDYAKHLNDGAAPEGMKTASGNDVAYRFYVPAEWEINLDEQIYSAVVPGDRSNVSVVPFMPASDSMSVGEYFAMSRDLMMISAGEDGFELLSDTEKADLGGRQATVYEYRLRVGGTFYRYRQYIAAYKSMIYSLTYTAREECYESHLTEVERIVNEFSFR